MWALFFRFYTFSNGDFQSRFNWICGATITFLFVSWTLLLFVYNLIFPVKGFREKLAETFLFLYFFYFILFFYCVCISCMYIRVFFHSIRPDIFWVRGKERFNHQRIYYCVKTLVVNKNYLLFCFKKKEKFWALKFYLYWRNKPFIFSCEKFFLDECVFMKSTFTLESHFLCHCYLNIFINMCHLLYINNSNSSLFSSKSSELFLNT